MTTISKLVRSTFCAIAKRRVFIHADQLRCLSVHHPHVNIDKHILYSPIPDVDIPDVPLHDYLLNGLDKWHQKVAFECIATQRKLTYAEVDKQSTNFAGFLQDAGLGIGDVIALVLPNVPEYFVVLIGAMKAGVTTSPCNPSYTSNEVKKQLINCGAKLVVTSTSLHATIKCAVDGYLQEAQMGLERVPIVTINHKVDEALPGGCISFSEVTSRTWSAFRPPGLRKDNILLLPYSSGTTGLPKGVQLTNANLVANVVQSTVPEFKLITETHGNNQEEIPIIMPMFHMYGLGVVGLRLFAHGVKFLSFPKFNFEYLQTLLRLHHPSIIYAVPPIILMLLNSPILKVEKLWSSVRVIISAAAPLGVAETHRFLDTTGGRIHLLQVYGMSETSPLTHHQSIMLKNGVKIGGSGITLPNMQCKFRAVGDETYSSIGPHQTGELLVKGPQVMKGYLNNDKATQDIMTADGWLKTGDVGHYDDDEHIFITDRLKELIKVKGFQVAPAELEDVLRDHPDINDAAVIGVPNAESGEAPKAFIVLRDGAQIQLQDVHKYMATKVVKYKQLRGGIVVVENIPKSASGKILRRNLKDL